MIRIHFDQAVKQTLKDLILEEKINLGFDKDEDPNVYIKIDVETDISDFVIPMINSLRLPYWYEAILFAIDHVDLERETKGLVKRNDLEKMRDYWNVHKKLPKTYELERDELPLFKLRLEEAMFHRYCLDDQYYLLFYEPWITLSNYDLENPDLEFKKPLDQRQINLLFGSLVGFAWIEETRYGKRYVLQKKSFQSKWVGYAFFVLRNLCKLIPRLGSGSVSNPPLSVFSNEFGLDERVPYGFKTFTVAQLEPFEKMFYFIENGQRKK